MVCLVCFLQMVFGVLGKVRVVFDKAKGFGRGNSACVVVHGDPSDGKSRPWNSRPWYSVSVWIARRFVCFFFDFFDFFVFLRLFSPSARCFLFPYPKGVTLLGLGTVLAMLN